ncbi:MAG: hypothetical protein ISR96_12650, partial [Nitrospira sp.]|nr:hypothetical protein [Nitrospira sp.]
SFLDYYLKDCRYEEDYITLLCEMTTCSDETRLTNPATFALFNIIIESLCDDFEELHTETYNRVMSQVISYCRGVDGGSELDTRLREFGLNTCDDIFLRAQSLRSAVRAIRPGTKVSKVLILSRVTIGADIAITSVVIQRMQKAFPEAAPVLIGSGKLREVYGGNEWLNIREVPYSRRGGLLQRLDSWHYVLQIISEETAGLSAEEVILVDPDSRLSQLGVLPLISPEQYYLFDSRSTSAYNSRMSMVELTNSWLDSLLGMREFCYPQVWIPAESLKKASDLCSKLRNNGVRKIIAVNLGVGGNARKSVSRALEQRLLLSLALEPETVLLLDKGFGEDELQNINTLMNLLKDEVAVHHYEDGCITAGISSGIAGLQTSIGDMAGLISCCDEFIGYDSACQHIAAASETPCITIFAGSNNMRFVRRWSAHGKNNCDIVHIDTLNNQAMLDIEDIVARIMHLRDVHISGAAQ